MGLILQAKTAPSSPVSGYGEPYMDSIAKILCAKDDAGRVSAYSSNAAIAAQGAGFSSDTFVTNSDLLIPSFSLQAKGFICWRISASKTGAGTAQPVYTIRTGTLRTTSDTSRLVLTGPLQTAVADIGTLNVLVTVRSVGGGSAAVLQGTAWWDHRGTAANTTTSGTGFANDSTGHVEATSAGFDSSGLGAGSYISLTINGGASASWTLTQVIAEATW